MSRLQDQLREREYQRLKRRQGQTETQDTPDFEIAARVYNNAAISIATATATALTFNSERFDTDTMHSTSVDTGRLTCVTAGFYEITVNIEWAANATGRRVVSLRVGGLTTIASLQAMAVSDGTVTRQSLTTVYELAEGDYVEVLVVQTSGGNLNVQATGNLSPEFSMVRVP